MQKNDTKRQQIIETAEKMFCKGGYEQTSVQDILDVLGFSKGCFYHYFKSKLALLDAICDARREQTEAATRLAVHSCAGDPSQKLNALFEKSSLWQGDIDYISMLLRAAYRDDSSLMREKLKQYQLAAALPIIDEIIVQGVRDKVFFVPHAHLAGEMILRLVAQFTDEIAAQLQHVTNPEQEAAFMPAVLDKLELYRHAVERILEAPYGSITIFSMERLAVVIRTLLSRA